MMWTRPEADPAMSARIHPTAIVHPKAELDEDVEVGAYAFIGPGVRIGAATFVHHHATVEGNTWIGRECEIFPFSCIGLKTQDLKYQGGAPGLRIGDRNVFREYSSVHVATFDGQLTVIGSDNHLLAYSHIAHDCTVGHHNVISSQVALGGHVTLQDHTNIGWGTGIHQFCRIGSYAMAGACSKVVQDVPPYLIADGNPAAVRSLNRVGLERAKFTPGAIELIKAAFRILYREGLNRSQALDKLESHPQAAREEIANFIAFARESERGFAAGAGGGETG
jgi:UDP-N-acetylglucosamine acyltransferase